MVARRRQHPVFVGSARAPGLCAAGFGGRRRAELREEALESTFDLLADRCGLNPIFQCTVVVLQIYASLFAPIAQVATRTVGGGGAGGHAGGPARRRLAVPRALRWIERVDFWAILAPPSAVWAILLIIIRLEKCSRHARRLLAPIAGVKRSICCSA